jgi:hypothetical protein
MSDTRDAYVKKVQAKLDEWNAEIDKMEAKSRQKEADLQAAYGEQIAMLKRKRQSAKAKLGQLQGAGESAWEDVKAGLEQATDVLGEAIRTARSRFS